MVIVYAYSPIVKNNNYNNDYTGKFPIFCNLLRANFLIEFVLLFPSRQSTVSIEKIRKFEKDIN